MAAIYLLLTNSALMIQRVDSTNQEGQSSSCVRCFVLSESLPLRVKPNSPLVTFKGYKMADVQIARNAADQALTFQSICNVSELGGTTQVRKFALKRMNLL